MSEAMMMTVETTGSAGPEFVATFFTNHAANSKREVVLSLDKFAALVRQTQAPTKKELPWVKFARFGDLRTNRGSLRNNENVTELSGILVDYDGEVMPVEDAVARLAAAGIWAIIYTSPSHRADRPRWRIGCPTSHTLSPDQHYQLVSRLNGLFGGVLSGESWTLSQSYYFGAVGDNPAHRAIVAYGQRTIDEADDLDAGAIGKPNGGGVHIAGVPEADIADIRAAIKLIPNDDRPWESDSSGLGWNDIGMAIWRASGGSEEGRECFVEFSRKLKEKFDEDETQFRWDHYAKSPPSKIGFGTLVFLARLARPDWMPPSRQRPVTLEDFRAFMPKHSYIFIPTRSFWPAASVNSRVGLVGLTDKNGRPILNKKGEQVFVPASVWLDQKKPVEQMTWAPGMPTIIGDRLVDDGGWVGHWGAQCFNLYRPPTIRRGDARRAERWVTHWRKIYPQNADHIIKWCAHRVQRPGEKINHGLLLIGPPGIGKDTLLAPVRDAVGPWNFKEVWPRQMTESRFNGYLKSVILRISETHDLGDFTRNEFYNHMKTITAAPPEVLRVDEKNLPEYAVFNCVGVIYTSNDAIGALYLPVDDRRTYVARSDANKEDFSTEYWNEAWAWYADGGFGDIAAYLAELDLTGFDAKAPPPRTEAFWAIVNAGRGQEEADLEDAIDALGERLGLLDPTVIRPKAITINMLVEKASVSLADWLSDRKNSRVAAGRLLRAGYVAVRNPNNEQGLWTIGGRRQTVYVRSEMSLTEQVAAAEKLTTKDKEAGKGVEF
jgi:hypothetical protein